MDFWHTNIFGGIWGSIIIFINWILIYVTGRKVNMYLEKRLFSFSILVCCRTTVGASTCALIWNIITLMATGVLVAFDIIFILNPYTCLLTPKCSTQPQVVSLNSIMQLIPTFKNYSSYDSKKFFLEIQVGCVGKIKISYYLTLLFFNIGIAFIISFIYIIIYIVCKTKNRRRIDCDYPAPATAPPPPSNIQYPNPHASPMLWANQAMNAPPYAPY